MITRLQNLFAKLKKLEKLSGDMQALATRKLHVMRQIVAEYQFRDRSHMDRQNYLERKVRRLSKLVDLHRSISKEYAEEVQVLKDAQAATLAVSLSQINSPKNLVPSSLPGLDL
jgi:hypothetical protein